jgi:hypothetical protein
MSPDYTGRHLTNAYAHKRSLELRGLAAAPSYLVRLQLIIARALGREATQDTEAKSREDFDSG